MACNVLSNITEINNPQKLSERLGVLPKFFLVAYCTRRFLAILYAAMNRWCQSANWTSLFFRSHESHNEREGYSHEDVNFFEWGRYKAKSGAEATSTFGH